MPADQPSGPPSGGGIRVTDMEYEFALSRTEDLMVQGYAPKDIAAHLIAEGLTNSKDTVAKWRQAVQRRWSLEQESMRPALKDQWRTRLDAQYRALLERAKATKSDPAFAMLHGEALKTARLAIDLDGLAAPIAITTSVGDQDPMTMAPHEREREINELLKMRDAALASRSSQPARGN